LGVLAGFLLINRSIAAFPRILKLLEEAVRRRLWEVGNVKLLSEHPSHLNDLDGFATPPMLSKVKRRKTMNIYRNETGRVTILITLVLALVIFIPRDVRAGVTFVYQGEPLVWFDFDHMKFFPPFQ